jgi:hypothetical protein
MLNDRTVEVLKAGSATYQRGRSYWANVVDPTTLRIYADNWIKAKANAEISPLFAVTGGEIERSLRDRFRPTNAAATTVAGTPATKLTGREGELYVSQSPSGRVLRFIGAASFTSPTQLEHIRLDYLYPAPLSLDEPKQFIDPSDHGTWPAQFAVEKADRGNCDPGSCQQTAVVRNHGGAPAGPDSATFTLVDDAGHSLGSCTANIPPIDHNQTETIECAVSGPDGVNFAARGGGSYSATVSVHNAIYDG